MATEDKRIDQLPGGSVYPENLLVMDQNGTAVQITLQQLLQFVVNGWGEQIVKYVAQTPTEEQKEQARDNIGAVANIRWDTTENTTNFIRDVGSKTIYNHLSFVRYDDYQTGLTEEEKAQARANIGAAATGEGGGGSSANAVLYIAQTLTEEQQRQARMNIRCGSVGDVAECVASGESSHAEGLATRATGVVSHSEGHWTRADGSFSHAEGYHTTAQRAIQHVSGAYNVSDTNGATTGHKGKYVSIVGNGTADDARSNAHTLDWEGVPWYAGDRVMLGGTGMDDENAVALMPIFAPQQLTEEQKQQARANIGAEVAGRMELIRKFQLTEDVSSINITTDDDGNTFRLDAAIFLLHTDNRCADGTSGAININFGVSNDPYRVRCYSASGFKWRGYEFSAGNFRNSGINAFASVKDGVGLCLGETGDFGNALPIMDMIGDITLAYCGDIKIESILAQGKFPANATVTIYGERVAD